MKLINQINSFFGYVIVKFILLVAVIMSCCISVGFTGEPDSLYWWDPAESDFPVLEGQGWSDEVKEPYNRLPARAEKFVRKPVWNLSRNSTGLIIRFKTTSQKITIKYSVKGRLNMPHFSTTGVSGLDLYSVDENGVWSWTPGKYKFGEKPGDTISYIYTVSKEPSEHQSGREYVLYLPIYNTVDWLKIGVPEKVVFEPIVVRKEKPIAIYGSSITQGACASRPGMAWPAIVGRRIDMPIINLGFSGNGTMDREMIELFAELDASMYVLDGLGNMMNRKVFPKEEVQARLIYAVKYLRAKRPHIPIVLVEFAAFSENRLDLDRGLAIKEQNAIQKEAFVILQKQGLKSIYLITAEEMNMGMNDTVDYGHPNDLGMTHYADAFENVFRKILTGAY